MSLDYFKVLASLGGDAGGALTAAKLHESYFNLVLKFVTSLRNSTKVKCKYKYKYKYKSKRKM